MTEVGSSNGSMSYPAEKAGLEELYNAVRMDRPYAVEQQAKRWEDLRKGLNVLAAVARKRAEDAAGASEGQASDSAVMALHERADRYSTAAAVAAANGANLSFVKGQMDKVRGDVDAAYEDWMTADTAAKGEGANEQQRQKIKQRFEERAQYAVWSAARDGKSFTDVVEPPNSTSGSRGGPGGAPIGDRGQGTPSGGPQTGIADPGGSSGGVPSQSGPQLQNPGTVPTAPAPTPTTPHPGGGSAPPPITPTPPPLAGTRPIPPPATPRPTPGQAGPSVSRPTPGLRPGLSGPRAGQTVKPVIGSRPGSTGMAPTGSRGPTQNGLSRPVIGARPQTGPAAGGRPGTVPGTGVQNRGVTSAERGISGGAIPGRSPVTTNGRDATSKPIIGRDGVASNPRRAKVVRVPKSHFGGEGTNRSVISGVRQAFKPETAGAASKSELKRDNESGSEYKEDGGDCTWTVSRETVPGVITGGDWSSRAHDPGRVADLRGLDPAVADEHDTFARLSRKDPASDEGEFPIHGAGRGVITGGKRQWFRFD